MESVEQEMADRVIFSALAVLLCLSGKCLVVEPTAASLSGNRPEPLRSLLIASLHALPIVFQLLKNGQLG